MSRKLKKYSFGRSDDCSVTGGALRNTTLGVFVAGGAYFERPPIERHDRFTSSAESCLTTQSQPSVFHVPGQSERVCLRPPRRQFRVIQISIMNTQLVNNPTALPPPAPAAAPTSAAVPGVSTRGNNARASGEWLRCTRTNHRRYEK